MPLQPPDTMVAPTPKPADALIVSFGLICPTIVTLVYFVWLADASATTQKTAYAIGKLVQFTLPVWWVIAVRRQWPRWPRSLARVGSGIVFGLVISALFLATYFLAIKPAGWFESAAAAIRHKADGMELGSPTLFIIVGVFYSVAHSLLEEYYWRWFVFGQLRRWLPLPSAIGLSAIGFTAHHVLVLVDYFGWGSPLTWAGAFSVGFGGAVWAYIYERSGSLVGPWMSHLLIDAAIFIVGYDLLRPTFH